VLGPASENERVKENDVLRNARRGAGASMDAFAVSVTASTSGHIATRRAAFRLSFHPGLFESHTSGEIFKQPRG
jgi:hypothetical protein